MYVLEKCSKSVFNLKAYHKVDDAAKKSLTCLRSVQKVSRQDTSYACPVYVWLTLELSMKNTELYNANYRNN